MNAFFFKISSLDKCGKYYLLELFEERQLLGVFIISVASLDDKCISK